MNHLPIWILHLLCSHHRQPRACSSEKMVGSRRSEIAITPHTTRLVFDRISSPHRSARRKATAPTVKHQPLASYTSIAYYKVITPSPENRCVTTWNNKKTRMNHAVPKVRNHITSRSRQPNHPKPMQAAASSDQVPNSSKTSSRVPVKNTKPTLPPLKLHTAHKTQLHQNTIRPTRRPRYSHPKHTFKPTPLPISTFPTTQPTQPDTTELAQRGEKTAASQTHAVLHKLIGCSHSGKPARVHHNALYITTPTNPTAHGAEFPPPRPSTTLNAHDLIRLFTCSTSMTSVLSTNSKLSSVTRHPTAGRTRKSSRLFPPPSPMSVHSLSLHASSTILRRELKHCPTIHPSSPPRGSRRGL